MPPVPPALPEPQVRPALLVRWELLAMQARPEPREPLVPPVPPVIQVQAGPQVLPELPAQAV